MTAQQRGPVFEVLGEVVSLIYRCARCGEKIEVSSHDLHKKHMCPKCGKQVNFVKRAHYHDGRLRTAASN